MFPPSESDEEEQEEKQESISAVEEQIANLKISSENTDDFRNASCNSSKQELDASSRELMSDATCEPDLEVASEVIHANTPTTLTREAESGKIKAPSTPQRPPPSQLSFSPVSGKKHL